MDSNAREFYLVILLLFGPPNWLYAYLTVPFSLDYLLEMGRSLVHLLQEPKYVKPGLASLSLNANSLQIDLILYDQQGDRFQINVTDLLTDSTMARSTSIVRYLFI